MVEDNHRWSKTNLKHIIINSYSFRALFSEVVSFSDSVFGFRYRHLASTGLHVQFELAPYPGTLEHLWRQASGVR